MEREAVHADLKNRDYRSWLRFLRESETWTLEQIAKYQLGELRRIVRHAYENSKGYRRLYDNAGITPDSLTALDDIRKFPFIEKEMMRDVLEEFSVELPGMKYVTTGGSTGIPFGMYRDQQSFPKELSSKAHQYYRVGWKEGDRQLVLRGIRFDSPDNMQFVPEFNELRCSSYHLVPQWMEVYRQRALEYKPEWIRCYPSSGYIFARFLKDTGRFFPAIKGILCASENIYDFQKELLSEVFGARVFSHYGHYELAVLAGFCEFEDKYHVLPQYGYAELIGVDGKPVTEPGQMGEIVGTSFIMNATPFIRYRTKDFAVFQSWRCPACGRPYQVWGRIEGRLQEFIVSGAGRYISMTAINMHDDIFDHIKQFQFLQEEKGRVNFHFIPKATCSEAVVKDMAARLQLKLGQDMELAMRAVEDIPLTPRGQHRFLIQKLELLYGDK